MANRFNNGWYVIYTRPKFEKKLCRQLIGSIPDLFLPKTSIVRSHGVRKRKIDIPLFPAYVFVYLNDMHNFYAGMRAEGFIRYIRSGSQIATVEEDVINGIRFVMQQTHEAEVTTTQFLPGRTIHINAGALSGIRGEIVRVNDNKKLLVRVNLLQRNLLMTLTPELLASGVTLE